MTISSLAILNDEPRWADIGDYLMRVGFDVLKVDSERELDAGLAASKFDAVLFSLEATYGSRSLYCDQLSRLYNVGLLVLGRSGDLVDAVVMLETGADDYIDAPCSPRELLARLRAVLRARLSSGGVRAAAMAPVRRFQGFTVDLLAQAFRTPEGLKVELSPTEFLLLRAFISLPHRILSREELLTLLRKASSSCKMREIDVLICKLRRKLGDTDRRLIRTVRGAGYQLTAKVDTDAELLCIEPSVENRSKEPRVIGVAHAPSQ